LNVLAYADDTVLIGKNKTKVRQLFAEMGNTARKLELKMNKETKIYNNGKDKQFKPK
jgi:hypothetical protein